jgi:uncharacterized membrane protein YgdD (TMEM256/DUF423 family)
MILYTHKNKMHKGLLTFGSALGGLSVILGAFAAHAIKSRVAPDVLSVFETGVRYQMYHVFAILLTAILYKDFPTKSMALAGKLFIIGIIIFSGSLYLLTYSKAISANNFLWLGAVTPFGGVAFIAGWVMMFKSFLRQKLN